MDLALILVATLVAGVGSVWVAGLLLRLGVRGDAHDDHGPQHLLSLAAGALMATAFMHLLPEAFESDLSPALLFGVLLFGLVLFFLLDKAQLWHHGHEHGAAKTTPASSDHHSAPAVNADAQGPIAAAIAQGHEHHHHGHGHHHHHHAHGHAHRMRGWALLTGDSVHCFGDGILIASAFVADWRLGVLAALAVLAHEVPHHVGDLIVLRRSSPDARVALLKVSLAGTVTALGGLLGWWLTDLLPNWLPYLLVLASSSFIYVALADLIPQLQRQLSAKQTLAQVAWLMVGIAMVALVSKLAHDSIGHSHDSDHAHGHSHAENREQAPAHSHAHDSAELKQPGTTSAVPQPASNSLPAAASTAGASDAKSSAASSSVDAAINATPPSAAPATPVHRHGAAHHGHTH